MTASGERQAGLHHVSITGPAGAPTAVFIHGAGADHTVWGNQIAAMRGRFGAIALDLPGHGRSPRIPEASIPSYARHVEVFLEGAAPTGSVLIGHSMGGAVALLLALDTPGLCRGVVLVGSGATLGVAPRILELLRGKIRSGDGPVAVRKFIEQSCAGGELPPAVERSLRTVPLPDPSVLLGDLVACGRFDVRGRVRSLRLPLFLICGDDDRLSLPVHSQWLARAVEGARLLLVPGAGHLVMIEKAAEVSAAILEFMSSLPGSGLPPQREGE